MCDIKFEKTKEGKILVTEDYIFKEGEIPFELIEDHFKTLKIPKYFVCDG